jgi:exodeoxyribonuclease VIII
VSTLFTDIEVIYDMPAADYFARPEVSRSELVDILKSPAKYQHKKANPTPPTPAMQTGSLIHVVTLTPGDFEKEYLVSDETSRRTKAWKADVEQAAIEGKECILRSDLKVALAIGATATDAFAHAFEGAMPEVVIIATHAETRVRIKARLDILQDKFVADLKTTKDASEAGFAKSVGNFRYDIQAAFYGDVAGALAGVEHLPFLFACVETEAPYLTAEWDLTEDWIENGRASYEWALQLYKQYEAEGYPTTLGKGTLTPKPWQLGG